MKERQDTLQIAQEYSKAHRRKTLWYRAVTCLAAVVVFCTTYALILPAITLEKKCEIPEHTHTDACYTQVTTREKRNPICAVKADVVVHRHDSACYDAEGNLWCTLPEVEAHRHTDACYTVPEVHSHTDACYTQERGECICTESTEPAHRHSDACYGETSVLICGEDHEHGESCYEIQRELICSLTEEPAHTHSDSCYQWNKVLTCSKSTTPGAPELACGKQEVILHTHEPYVSEENPGCYDTDGKTLVCGKTQVVEHQHTAACFETVTESVDTETQTCTNTDPDHVHTALCYGTWELTCGMEEHTHSEECAGSEETVFCGKEVHTHEEACRDENGELVCTLEEHTHSLACYSDPNADVETAEIWKQTFADVELTGDWPQDVIAIAQTQLGYTESTKNYMVAEDGETVKGYTRYGAWYGDPYADWDAMFVSFCLHYAGVEDVPMDADCGSWATAWADGFVPAQSHEAAAGDLVFFDRDGDGAADHAGLVTEVTDSGFTAIEGDAEDAVRLLSYGADDSTILGYVNLPEGAREFTLTAQTETGITVTITGDSASVPYPAREITVTVKEVTEEESFAIRDQLLGEEAAEPEQSFLLDITLWHGEEKIEPTGPVTVTFSGFDTEGLYPKVYHIDAETQTATDMEAKKTENGDVSVATDHFSWYNVQLLTVPNGKGIEGDISTQLSSGGTFYLTGNAWTDNTIPITGTTILDLNGYGVYYKGTGNFLEVKNGAVLTIQDSGSVQPTNVGSGNAYGNAASLDFDGNRPSKLTYYVTDSTVSGTGTSETTVKYEMTPKGFIVAENPGGAAAVVYIESGTFNLEGGLLTIKNSSNFSGDAHVIINRATLNMSGGYVAGGKDACWGGGIFSENGTVNMSGGVIAANYGTNGGGLCVKGGSFTMTGGVISGNETTGNATTGNWDTGLGGGVFAQDTTVTISGGYITNNRESSKCEQNGFGCHGGGGIATRGGSITMQGGFVTGNYSQEAGGGMYVGHYNYGNPAAFVMTGGIVAGNVAEQSEGGGIRISGKTNGTIQASGKVYITNNRTNSTFDWGGGGIFVQESGNLNITNALITSNSAGGFGGGVGACPTGETMVVHNDGAAIYRNTADGTTMSGGGNGKIYDVEAKNDPNFTYENRFQDYFCVKKVNTGDYISLVTGEMVGGGAANWKGSCDGEKIEISKTGHAAARYRFGLTAYPDDGAISSAQAVAGVIISGNSAHTHGGGIMTNGGLILGKKDTVITATPALDITGTKALLKDGVSQSDGLDFQFQLKDSSDAVVGTATANASTGEFTISPNTKYSKAGTYTYTLSEVNDGKPGITYDASKYTIQVTIAKKEVTLLDVKFTSYYVSSVNISKSGGADTTEPTQPDTHPNTFRVHFKNSNNWPSVNMYIWDGNDLPNSASWPGDQVDPDPAHPDWYTKEFTVSRSNSFKYKFNYYNNNQTVNQTGDLSGNYFPGGDLWVYADGSSTTTAPDDWNGGSSGSNVSFTGTKNSDESYSLAINGSAFTNTKQTTLNLQLIKTDSNDTSKRLEGATFLLKQAGAETGTEATTGKNGIATFEGIGRNTTYYLYETTPPANYMTAGPWILEVAESTATLYPAAEGVNGTLTKTSDTGTALSVSGSDPIVLTATISDQPWGYELPNTGGAGTQLYTMGGCLLTAGAVYLLLYSHRRRRKEDAVSS